MTSSHALVHLATRHGSMGLVYVLVISSDKAREPLDTSPKSEDEAPLSPSSQHRRPARGPPLLSSSPPPPDPERARSEPVRGPWSELEGSLTGSGRRSSSRPRARGLTYSISSRSWHHFIPYYWSRPYPLLLTLSSPSSSSSLTIKLISPGSIDSTIRFDPSQRSDRSANPYTILDDYSTS